MILKGSQRGGARQLAVHLLNDRDNDHVTVAEMRGFASLDLYGALAEAEAVSKATRCRQFVFSLSLSPPKDAEVTRQTLLEAAQAAEERLGLEGQPRAFVLHEKNGRLHAHVVWSRIDPITMTAVTLPFFKNRLCALSKELYLQHGWELPEGHRENGWKNPLNFTLAEWQQCKRLDIDPREVKLIFRQAWTQSDNLRSFKAALEEHGYYLARGDRRGLVAVGMSGEVFSVARYAGVKTKEAQARLKGFESLPGVAEVTESLRGRLKHGIRKRLADDLANKRTELRPLTHELREMISAQRAERQKLKTGQEQRRQDEARQRAAKLRTGLGKVLDVLTGRIFKVRRENERDAFLCHLRDTAQSEAVFNAQLKERIELQARLDVLKTRHVQERRQLVRDIAATIQTHVSEFGRSPIFQLWPGQDDSRRLFSTTPLVPPELLPRLQSQESSMADEEFGAKNKDKAKAEFKRVAPPPPKPTPEQLLMAASKAINKKPAGKVLQRLEHTPLGKTVLRRSPAIQREAAKVPLVDASKLRTDKTKKIEFKRTIRPNRSPPKSIDRD